MSEYVEATDLCVGDYITDGLPGVEDGELISVEEDETQGMFFIHEGKKYLCKDLIVRDNDTGELVVQGVCEP